MSPDYRLFSKWLETYISAPRGVDIGFYDRCGRLTPAGLICFALYLIKNGVFDSEREMAVEYAKETGRLMPVPYISTLIIADMRESAK